VGVAVGALLFQWLVRSKDNPFREDGVSASP